MKAINAKIIKEEENIEIIKQQRDKYEDLLEMIYKEIILNDKDEYSKEDNIEYLKYLLKDFIERKEN